jgi:hypothetical protein
MSYKEKIIKTLENQAIWLPSYKLMNTETPYGWLGKSGDRRARELAETGLIERRINGKYVEYRAIPKTKFPPPFKEKPQQTEIKQPSLL